MRTPIAAAGLAALVLSAAAIADDGDWRALDPENTLYIETDHGRIVVELIPEFAPLHVERMKTLARENFYDFTVWHRVIDGFMAQGGGTRANPAHSTTLPDLQAEFAIRRGPEMEIMEIQNRVVNERNDPRQARAGFWNGFPVGTESIALAGLTADGRVESWPLHCRGAASMARTSNPDSAGSQFYITRSHAEHLNNQYTVWGRVRAGQEAVEAIRVGTMGETRNFTPDNIRSIRVAADVPEAERTHVEVMRTESDAFAAHLTELRAQHGGDLPDVCAIEIPTRITE